MNYNMNYTIRQWLNEAQQRLEQHEKSPREARYIVEYVLSIPLAQLLLEYERPIMDNERDALNVFLDQRVKGIPFQQITHEQMFMGHKFYVNEHVLIPRPETEELVECVEDLLKEQVIQDERQRHILDLCTGSGCIVISLKDNADKCGSSHYTWYGSDISDKAIEVAKHNEKQIIGDEAIQWSVGSLFDPFPKEIKFDVIVSNPPYIPIDDMAGLMQEVKDYEPSLALTDGEDGLTFYRQIAKEGYERLSEGGILAFEIGHGQMKEVVDIMVTNGYVDVVGRRDYAGLERQVIGKKPIIPD